MNAYKKTSRLAGTLFLLAMATSLVGGGLIEPVLNAPDYLIQISANKNLLIAGISLELINGIAVAGIAIVLFPLLRQYNENIAVGYVSFRIIESVCCIFSAIIPLSLITLTEKYGVVTTPPNYLFQITGVLLIGVRTNLTGLLIPVFFSLGAFLFYYLLYRSILLPRFISVWGLIGVVLVLILNLFDGRIITGMILSLPIILNEIFLGIWLIVKGFNISSIAAEPG